MVRIITDTTAGTAAGTYRKLGIPVIPQNVIFGERPIAMTRNSTR